MPNNNNNNNNNNSEPEPGFAERHGGVHPLPPAAGEGSVPTRRRPRRARQGFLRPRRFRHRPRERRCCCCCCCCCSSRAHVSPPRVHVSQFGAIEREVALLGALCPFELNPRRRLKLHEKRVELLSPPLKLLNEKSYAQIVRQVRHRRFGDRPEIFGDRPEIRRSSGDSEIVRRCGRRSCGRCAT